MPVRSRPASGSSRSAPGARPRPGGGRGGWGTVRATRAAGRVRERRGACGRGRRSRGGGRAGAAIRTRGGHREHLPEPQLRGGSDSSRTSCCPRPGTVTTMVSPDLTVSASEMPEPLTRSRMISTAWSRLSRGGRLTVRSDRRERHGGAARQVEAVPGDERPLLDDRRGHREHDRREDQQDRPGPLRVRDGLFGGEATGRRVAPGRPVRTSSRTPPRRRSPVGSLARGGGRADVSPAVPRRG